MRSSFTRISVRQTCRAAEAAIARLRQAGLHPVDLSLSMPLTAPGAEPTYPIEVPVEEADLARQIIRPGDRLEPRG